MKKIGKKDMVLKCLNEMFSEKLEDDEFTIREMTQQSEQNGKEVSKSAARHRMDKLVENGKATSRKVLIDGNWALVYRML
jgi:DNA-binding transcriptional regulator WhiA